MKNEKMLKDWYVSNENNYRKLASSVVTMIEDALKDKLVDFHYITYRIKDWESFNEKSKNEKYVDPSKEIKDVAGVRIITFTNSDVKKCCEVIETLFNIDENHSVNKNEQLGSDKMGYRSIHYIAELNNDAVRIPLYSNLKGMCFEIQVRTILEHAWADISHDRTYKFKGILPLDNDIDRRFSLASATLEFVDREFDLLVQELDEYAKNITDETLRGNLDYDINNTSLDSYLREKFRSQIEAGQLKPTYNNGQVSIVNELTIMGIKKLRDLDIIIEDIKKDYTIDDLLKSNFLGLLRRLMIIKDGEKYFSEAWNKGWIYMGKDYLILNKFGVEIQSLVDKFMVGLFDK